MDILSVFRDDEHVRERRDGIKEVLTNHYRWLRQYTGVEPDPSGVVEVGEQYKDLTNVDHVILMQRIDRMEGLGSL